jgi:predicted transcriptional regulator
MADKIGEAEQAVMEALWSATEALTATEVAQRAGPERNWSESTVKTMLSRRFLDRLFDGRVAPLVAQLAKSDELSPEDIADLEALLAKLRQ